MNEFNIIIHRYRAVFTRVAMFIASLGTITLGFFSSIGLDNLSNLTIFLWSSGAIFLLCTIFLSGTRRYKISAYTLVIITLLLITYTIFSVRLPLVSGAFTFMPAIIASATILCNIPVGFSVFLYCVGIILFTSSLPIAALQNIGFDFTIWVDRTLSCICTFAVAAMSEYTMRLALAHIENQKKEIQINEKLSSLGVFVGGIAHEINNPLAVMMGAFNIIKRRLKKSSDAKDLEKWIKSIDEGSERISHIIQSLLFFTQDSKQRLRSQKFYSQSAINDAIRLLSGRLEQVQIELKLSIDPSICIEGNLMHLSSIVRILVENSIDSLKDFPVASPKIEIQDFVDGESYVLTITDNGCGISEEIQTKILDPFFTTKEQGRGSGMGLALAYSICNVLGWKIKFESTKGKTKFSVIMERFESDQEKSS